MSSQVAEEGTSLADIDVTRPVHMEATQWDSVATWAWDVPSEMCAICKNSLATMCVGCTARASGGGDSVSPRRPSDYGADASADGSASANTATPPPPALSNSGTMAPVPATVSAAPSSRDRSPPPPPSRGEPKATDLSYVASVMASLKTGMSDKTYGSCAIAWGLCNHVFHAHCISKWLTTRQVCPVCGKQWEVYKLSTND